MTDRHDNQTKLILSMIERSPEGAGLLDVIENSGLSFEFNRSAPAAATYKKEDHAIVINPSKGISQILEQTIKHVKSI